MTTSGLFKTLFGGNRHKPKPDEEFEISPQISNYRRTSAYLLSVVMLVLLFISMGLNWYEGNTSILLPLATVCISPVIGICWLLRRKTDEKNVLYLLCGTLVLLGVYLLFNSSSLEGGSLFWFLLFPPMVMLTMGLRHGSILFCAFYLLLLIILVSPLEYVIPKTLPKAMKLRFLFAMLGAFVFSWCAEYLRENVYVALHQALGKMEYLALTDPLTGLGNRRDFDNYFNWTMAHSSRDNLPFSLALIDVDHFKVVNDQFGHDIGDQVLRHIANQINTHMRATDRLFRWGGEEFVILMPDSNIETARIVAERVRSHIEKSPYETRTHSINCTISIGLYSGEPQPNPSRPILQADQNLYIAKKNGRNRFVG